MGQTSSIDVKLNLAAKEAAAEILNVRSALDDVETAEGDVESAGKIMARALSQAATDIEADLKDSARAADALGNALGPELANQVGRSGLDGFVNDLKKAGLTTLEIEADADKLAAAIKHLDDVGQQMDGLRGGLRKVGTELDNTHAKTDQNRSVMANWAGNTAQELPGVASAFGPLQMALSQTVEYSAEGGINFKKMLGAGLAMAAVSVVVAKITGELAKEKEMQEASNKRVDDYTKAIRSGKDATEDLANAAEQAGGQIKGMFGNDITSDLEKLGMTAEQFFALVKGGKPAIEDWHKAMKDAGVSGDELGNVLLGALSASAEYEKATERAAAQTKVFGESEEVTKEKTAKLEAAQKSIRDAVDKVADAVKEQRQNLIDLIATQLEAIGNTGDLEQQVRDVESGYYALTQRIAENDLKQADSAVTDGDKEQSARDLASALHDQAEKVLALSETYATEEGAAQSSKEAHDRQRDSLILAQGRYPLLATEIQKYIDKLNEIPTTVTTDVGTRFNDKTRYKAEGGFSAGGRTRVGERGPEDVDLPPGAYVTPNDQRRLNGEGNTIVYQILPHGVSLQDLVIQANRSRNRRNGF